MLFDLVGDPGELVDLGGSAEHANVRAQLAGVSEAQLLGMRGKSSRKGILIGVWDETDVPPELWSGYPGVTA